MLGGAFFRGHSVEDLVFVPQERYWESKSEPVIKQYMTKFYLTS